MSKQTTITISDIFKWSRPLEPTSYFTHAPAYIGYISLARKKGKLKRLNVNDKSVSLIFSSRRYFATVADAMLAINLNITWKVMNKQMRLINSKKLFVLTLNVLDDDKQSQTAKQQIAHYFVN